LAMSCVRSGGPGSLFISLAISLSAHAAALAALVQLLGASPSGSDGDHGGRGGAGPVFVELIGRDGATRGLPSAVPSLVVASGEPETVDPELRSASQSAKPVARVAARQPAPSETTAQEPASAPSQPHVVESPATTKTFAARQITAASGMTSNSAPGSSEFGNTGGSPSASDSAMAAGGASSQGPLSRVARPASSIRPRYPDAARERGDEAEVIVEAWVAASGRVERARIQTSAGREFDAAALEAVHAARFYPASLDGKPVPSVVAMRLHFELED